MIERIAETSPRFKARMAGVFYLLMFPTGGLAVFARRGLVVNGDAAATATNILAHEPLFRLGFAADLLVVACYLAVTALFYDLFKPVNRSVLAAASGEGLLTLWLLVKGVNVPKWQEKARAWRVGGA